MTWKEKVLNLMQENNINQKQLAQMTGITESSISRYLHNDQLPRIDIIVNVAKALHVQTEYLLNDDEENISAYDTIATAIARKGNELSLEERARLAAIILGRN